MPLLHIAIPNKVYLGQDLKGLAFDNRFQCLHLSQAVQYEAYCDDFGPMNMSSTIDFVRLLDEQLASFADSQVIVVADHGSRGLTNAVFLIGAYMMVKLEMAPDEVAHSFRWLDPDSIESYRDATYSTPDFRLHLVDCWRGLAKGRELGWIRYGGTHYLWGDIDVDEYRHYDSPANGNLHEVVPGKFIAFQGPRDLGGADFRDDKATGARHFSPDFYVDILRDMGAETVVQLNEARYSAVRFTSRGLAHHHLEFQDCTCPPDAVVEAFLRAADATKGAVAVHCHAGLGRTGTLIALYMMRTYGFSARAAMGWLRIMRPGSVIGEQQRYLCAVEAAGLPQADSDLRAGTSAWSGSASDEGGAEPAARAAELSAQVAAGMVRRCGSSEGKKATSAA